VTRTASRRSFLALGVGAAAGLVGWEWLTTRPEADGLPYPLRRALEFNERLSERYVKPTRLASTFPRAMAREPRLNGGEGLSPEFDPSRWRLEVLGGASPTQLTLEDLNRLPRVEMTTEFMCIEGWSVIVNWAGARFSDFAADYHPPRRSRAGYVGLNTPDGQYYVGLDMKSALHPQTLLCYEMNGRPLSIAHGAPLRLVATVKYGIKSIKRIGRITFTDERPPDFWAERGYDWYAGL
jgi:DMSO/TMAO reductase YedYZ molybdopterin-dependent catalytic subunit